MKNHKKLAGLLVLGIVLGAGGSAVQAQGGPGGGGQGGGQGGFGGGQGNMTPEQRQQRQQEMREQRMRAALTAARFTDPALQDTVVAYANNEEKVIAPLRERNRQFLAALSTGILTPEQATTALTAMRTVVTQEKERRAKAQQELEAAIGYSQQPVLEALLTSLGVIGDEAAILNGSTQAGGGPGMGGMGRGGRGGMGGQGGGQGGQRNDD
jgi:hypothetical protein